MRLTKESSEMKVRGKQNLNLESYASSYVTDLWCLMHRLIQCVLVHEDLTFNSEKMGSSSSFKIPFERNNKIKFKVPRALYSQKELEQQFDQSTAVNQADSRKLQPGWLEGFLQKTFFDSCSKHPIRRNELNRYCIDCDASLCQYCLSLASHRSHRVLKIYRHVYKDVVPLDEIERQIDCSRIQPYRCNKQLVIALTPLPHCGGNASEEETCQTCKRKLIEHAKYSFCSISCKVAAFRKKEDDSAPPFLLLDQAQQNPEQVPQVRKRKRKGIPHRAPLF